MFIQWFQNCPVQLQKNAENIGYWYMIQTDQTDNFYSAFRFIQQINIQWVHEEGDKKTWIIWDKQFENVQWWFNWQYSWVLSSTKNWHLSPTYKLWPATFCPRIFTLSWHLLNYWKLKLNLIITWNLGSQLKSQHIHFEQQFLFYANFVSI